MVPMLGQIHNEKNETWHDTGHASPRLVPSVAARLNAFFMGLGGVAEEEMEEEEEEGEESAEYRCSSNMMGKTSTRSCFLIELNSMTFRATGCYNRKECATCSEKKSVI